MRVKVLRSGFIGASALAIAVAGPAVRAADLSVATATTTPVTTAAASANTPGNITVTSAGSIIVTTGTAVTVNSSNTLTNSGTISSSAASGAVAVAIDGTTPITTTITNNNIISVTGTGGSGNIGLLLSKGPVIGTIVSGPASSITVSGDNALGVSLASGFTGNIGLRSVAVAGTNSTAVSVTGPLTGNLTLTGASASNGAGGYGLLVSGPVSGTISNLGSISVGTQRGTDSTNNIVNGKVGLAGVRIASNVGTGFLNDRYYVDANGAIVPPAQVNTATNTLVTGGIFSTGSAPALWIAPDATTPQAITLGTVGTGNDAYAIVNRGQIQTGVAAAGQATLGVRIGGGGATTTLVGGFNSQANSSIIVGAVDASATGIDVLSGAVVPQIRNQGTLTTVAAQTSATSSTPAGAGGAAFGIIVEAGASVPSIVNSGTINTTSNGPNNNATAITDRSGTLTSIANTGTIAVTAGATTGRARAIDLTTSAAAVTVANSGTITGDILFGNGASTLQASAGTITGTIAFGTGSNRLDLSGTAALSNIITSGSALNVTLAGTSRLDLTNGPSTLQSLSASSASILVVPVRPGTSLLVNGAADFSGTSKVRLSVQSLALNQNLTIIQANGGFTTDHLATLIDSSVSPFLFTASAATVDGTRLQVTLNRKTAAELGLVGGQAALYNSSIGALANAPAESAAIANLPDQASVVAAYRAITPPSFGRAPLRTAQAFADTGFGAAAQRLATVADIRQSGAKSIGIWAQEIGDFAKQAPGINDLGFTSNTFGLAGGVDAPLLGADAIGLALLSSWASVGLNQGVGKGATPLDISMQGVSPYASWSWKRLFVQVSALAGRVTYDSKRTLTIGTFSDTVTAHWTGTQFGAGFTVGANFKRGRWSILPTNSLYWTQLRQGGYTEQGGGAFALKVNSQTESVVANTTKLSLAYTMPVFEGSARAEIHGGYVHQFRDNPTQTVAQFISATDAIVLPADAEKADKLTYGGSLGYLQDALRVTLGYDRRQSSGFHDQSFALVAGFAF